MICPKCDSSIQFDGYHCSFCGFVVVRHPTEKEINETTFSRQNKLTHRRGQPNFNRCLNNDSESVYSIDDYSIMKVKQEQFLREAM